jgi:hypothetical protein
MEKPRDIAEISLENLSNTTGGRLEHISLKGTAGISSADYSSAS